VPESTTFIDGVAVRTTGSGPAIVLLHANGGDHRDFDAVVDRLADRHTVHVLDWPGWGDSPADHQLSAVGYAELLTRLLELLSDGPFALVGNSVGGFAAIRAAAERPELVRSLVLVDPGGFTPRWPGTVVACRTIGSRRLAPSMMRTLPRLYLRRPGTWVDEVRARAVRSSTDQRQVDSFRAIWRSFAHPDHDARDAAKRLSLPTLLIWGRRDPVLPWLVDGRRARHSIAHAEVALMPCGHQAHVEMPDEFLEVVGRFLEPLRTESGWR
jgi:pimeloyl-ACP methyl ester carboxylesterase